MRPTLVLMVKAPTAGAVKTRLASSVGALRATAIYRALVERQLLAVPATWPVVVCFDPPEREAAMRTWLMSFREAGVVFSAQTTGDLGQRLSAATADAFEAEAEAVILIGGDCPYLTGAILEAAAVTLAATDVVLGPASDGGYYLIGLRRPEPALFSGIAWSSPQVLAQTRARCMAAGLSVREVAELEDVDDEASWRRAVAAGVLA